MKCKIFSILPILVALASCQEEVTNPPSEEMTPPPVGEVTLPDDLTGPEEVDRVVPKVTIAQGTVVGSVASSGDHFEFYGIPYADSTSGRHRFKAPLPAPSFQDIFIAHRKDIKCVRALGVGYEGTEDCLVANVFTPTIDSDSKLPVMVWIKGKEFDGVYDHELSFSNIVKEEVIVVALNYRESILGFLCLGTETAPGNAGLKDIIAGLRWVKDNIEHFGGDPNAITLFGHGSGAAAVDLVTLSPMAEGLVQKAIAQSGNALAPWAVSRDTTEYAVQVAEALGHEVTDIQQLSQIFERTSVAALMGVINELDLTENALAFAPCVEREDLENVEPFLLKTPSEIFDDGTFLHIPFITGFVDNEGTIRAAEALEDDWLNRMDGSFSEFLPSDLKFASDAEKLEVTQQIRQFYFEEDPIDMSTVGDYIAYHGETMVLVSSIREARTRAQASSAPTYLYQFSYKGALGEPYNGPLEMETASHSEELGYLFTEPPETASDWDITIGEILVERWTNFAKTGTPTSQISTTIWQPFTTESSSYIRVVSADEIIETNDATFEIPLMNPHPETLTFWNSIYENHFLDAQSNWDVIDRNEDDDDENNEGSGEGEGEDEGDGEGEGEGGDEDDDKGDENNSATTTVGYTFLVVTLFSLLNKFHSLQLIS